MTERAIGLVRVTVSGPQRRVDVALPAHEPLAELLPEVLRHAGDGLADDGERHGGWLLRRADGTALAPARAMFGQGVRDGEVLHLVPARVDWPELEYDDVVEAIAAGARRRGAVWSPSSTRVAGLAGAGVLFVVGQLAVLRAGPGTRGTAFVGLGLAVLLTLAATAASRAYGEARAGATLGAGALLYAFAGGALLPGADTVGGPAPLPWLGGPQLLTGAVAVLLFAMLGGLGVAASIRIFAAGATVGLGAALTALAGLLSTGAGAAAGLVCVLVCGVGALPLLAIRLGRLPTPPVTVPTGAQAADGFVGAGADAPHPSRDRPDRATVFAAVRRVEELLAGLLLGHAVLAVAAFTMLAATGRPAARILLAVAAGALLLRSRPFVTLRQRVPLVVAGLGGVAALGIDLLRTASADVPSLVTLGAAALALVSVVAGATYARRPPSPYLSRAADLADTLLVVSVIPVACAVLGLYDRLGGLAG